MLERLKAWARLTGKRRESTQDPLDKHIQASLDCEATVAAAERAVLDPDLRAESDSRQIIGRHGVERLIQVQIVRLLRELAARQIPPAWEPAPADTPRKKLKRRYQTKEAGEMAAKMLGEQCRAVFRVYPCPCCGEWHLATKGKAPEQTPSEMPSETA